ncbi:hypothetical protein ACPCG0_08650 [Propionibacteriaceae bacterium Y1923]|uniref:hypothetical protein n=1 Tax=Aestuariimicrobium sp. Y1814 TaxID=3418742 RepID=UPI003C206417
MSAVVVAMIIIVVLALAVTAVVAIGMRGKMSDRNPAVAERLGTVAKHLNGDAEAPASLVQFYETSSERVRQVAKR